MLVSATVVGELFDGVAELMDVDGVAAGPSIPQLKGFDLSSQDRYLVEGVAEPNPGVVAIERRSCLFDACPRLVVLVDVRAGAVPDALEVFDGELGGATSAAASSWRAARRPRNPVVSRRSCASVCCHRA